MDIWDQIKNDPVNALFFISTTVAATWGLSCLFLNHFHKKEISHKDHQIKMLEINISSLEQRLGFMPEGSPYSRLTLPELKEEALSLIDKLKELQTQCRHPPLERHISEAENDPEPAALQKWREQLAQQNHKMSSLYQEHYKIKVLLLRDELSKRLNDRPYIHDISRFDHPTNSHGLQEVIDSLSIKAELLI